MKLSKYMDACREIQRKIEEEKKIKKIEGVVEQ